MPTDAARANTAVTTEREGLCDAEALRQSIGECLAEMTAIFGCSALCECSGGSNRGTRGATDQTEPFFAWIPKIPGILCWEPGNQRDPRNPGM
eukprot:1366788-Amorphochlora_amoeboformis.AAC.2